HPTAIAPDPPAPTSVEPLRPPWSIAPPEPFMPPAPKYAPPVPPPVSESPLLDLLQASKLVPHNASTAIRTESLFMTTSRLADRDASNARAQRHHAAGPYHTPSGRRGLTIRAPFSNGTSRTEAASSVKWVAPHPWTFIKPLTDSRRPSRSTVELDG